MSSSQVVCQCIEVRGTVQGVGFRPFVYRLARRHELRGWIANQSCDVKIVAEGPPAVLDDFICALRAEAPPLARIDSLSISTARPAGVNDFEIRSSLVTARAAQPAPADAATCGDCLRELFDSRDRRFRYPFINCTNCGPRFTIIDGVPYDRQRTTMAGFGMCAECRQEYDDPNSRRFHAQPNACPVCGPKVTLRDADGTLMAVADPLAAAALKLRAGAILAVKGLGGYHLAVDGRNEQAVARLRLRKHRQEKPFALMAKDLDAVRSLAEVSRVEADLLQDPRRPIVLVRRRRRARVAESVAPGHRYLGCLLPYSPLHHLLLADLESAGMDSPLLVMTSGNVSDEPIAYRDADALQRLAAIADAFLTHDRPIRTRCDDSVTRSVEGQEMIVRRARGYAPEPISLPFSFDQPVLACGAHQKNTFCFGVGDVAHLGPHVGDLENFAALDSFTAGIKHFQQLLDIEPRILAHDLHPEYLATKFADGYAEQVPGVARIGVQHHHAHVASVLAEHGLVGPVLGVAFDGTGYGSDGCLWGAEFLVADRAAFQRAAHLDYMPLPGGQQAIRQPWRMAVAYLHRQSGPHIFDLQVPLLEQLNRRTSKVLLQMMDRQVNSPMASSMGRLFDAVAALVMARQSVAYEGEAAVELEMLADLDVNEGYAFSIQEGRPLIIKAEPLMQELVRDLENAVPPGVVAARFHHAVAVMTAQVCRALRRKHGLDQVALSGGVFQNALLLTKTCRLLRQHGFSVYTNQRVPANDGGISLGQAAIAAAKLGTPTCA